MLKWIFIVLAVLPAFFIIQIASYMLLGPGILTLLFSAVICLCALRLVHWLCDGFSKTGY